MTGATQPVRDVGHVGESDAAREAAAHDVVAKDLADMAARAEPALRQMDGGSVLLTGGAGFLGYYFVQLFAHWTRDASAGPKPARREAPDGPKHAQRDSEADAAPDGAAERRGIRVTVADSFVRGRPAWLDALHGRNGIDVLEHDVTEPLPSSAGPFDWVIHAASIASPTYYRRFPLETMDANVGGLRLLLDRAVEQSAAGTPLHGFLLFSTSEVYGDPPPEWIPTPETYRGNVSCTGPRACYDESKRFAETLGVTFASQYGVPVRIVRPFNNYGPGLRIDDRRVIPDFARDILSGRDITMHSDGSPTRTFCYIADAVVGYLLALTDGRDGEPYNIGSSGPEISMAELAELMAALASELYGYEGRVIRQASPEAAYLVDNPTRRRPDIAKAESEIGYRSIIDLDEGLRRSLIWYGGN